MVIRDACSDYHGCGRKWIKGGMENSLMTLTPESHKFFRDDLLGLW